jgi:hypothetical protein
VTHWYFLIALGLFFLVLAGLISHATWKIVAQVVAMLAFLIAVLLTIPGLVPA